MTKMNPDSIIQNVLKVAALPQTYKRINNLLNDPSSSTNDLAKVIEEDPVLTAKLLKISNSAFYGFSVKIESVSHAINVLGTQQLRELVLACSVCPIFKDIPEDLIRMEDFWKHSIACGVVSRAIASHLHENNIERFFVGGLLHDIGRLILLIQIPKEMTAMMLAAKKNGQLLYEVEQETLGFNHALIGGMLLENWQLSSRLCESVSCHHKPQQADRFPIEAAILHVSDIIVHAFLLGNSGIPFVPKLENKTWDMLNLDLGSIRQVIETMHSQYREATAFIL